MHFWHCAGFGDNDSPSQNHLKSNWIIGKLSQKLEQFVYLISFVFFHRTEILRLTDTTKKSINDSQNSSKILRNNWMQDVPFSVPCSILWRWYVAFSTFKLWAVLIVCDIFCESVHLDSPQQHDVCWADNVLVWRVCDCVAVYILLACIISMVVSCYYSV